MCALAEGKWSVVIPPKGAVPGDRVVFDSYQGTPDAQLNPKKKASIDITMKRKVCFERTPVWHLLEIPH